MPLASTTQILSFCWRFFWRTVLVKCIACVFRQAASAISSDPQVMVLSKQAPPCFFFGRTIFFVGWVLYFDEPFWWNSWLGYLVTLRGKDSVIHGSRFCWRSCTSNFSEKNMKDKDIPEHPQSGPARPKSPQELEKSIPRAAPTRSRSSPERCGSAI